MTPNVIQDIIAILTDDQLLSLAFIVGYPDRNQHTIRERLASDVRANVGCICTKTQSLSTARYHLRSRVPVDNQAPGKLQPRNKKTKKSRGTNTEGAQAAEVQVEDESSTPKPSIKVPPLEAVADSASVPSPRLPSQSPQAPPLAENPYINDTSTTNPSSEVSPLAKEVAQHQSTPPALLPSQPQVHAETLGINVPDSPRRLSCTSPIGEDIDQDEIEPLVKALREALEPCLPDGWDYATTIGADWNTTFLFRQRGTKNIRCFSLNQLENIVHSIEERDQSQHQDPNSSNSKDDTTSIARERSSSQDLQRSEESRRSPSPFHPSVRRSRTPNDDGDEEEQDRHAPRRRVEGDLPVLDGSSEGKRSTTPSPVGGQGPENNHRSPSPFRPSARRSRSPSDDGDEEERERHAPRRRVEADLPAFNDSSEGERSTPSQVVPPPSEAGRGLKVVSPQAEPSHAAPLQPSMKRKREEEHDSDEENRRYSRRPRRETPHSATGLPAPFTPTQSVVDHKGKRRMTKEEENAYEAEREREDCRVAKELERDRRAAAAKDRESKARSDLRELTYAYMDTGIGFDEKQHYLRLRQRVDAGEPLTEEDCTTIEVLLDGQSVWNSEL